MLRVLATKTGMLMLFMGIFVLSTWTVQSNTLFSMHHAVESRSVNKDGSITVVINLELTNHSTTDLSSIELNAITNPLTDHSSQLSHVQLEYLASGETAIVNWHTRTRASMENWKNRKELIFTGNAISRNNEIISLTITSTGKTRS